MKRILISLGLALSLTAGLIAQQAPAIQPETLLSSVTTGTSLPLTYDQLKYCREAAIVITWASGVTGGAVTVESSDDSTYTSTWASLAVVAFNTSAASVPKKDIVQITGVDTNIRARVSTTVSGGSAPSVTVTGTCN